MVLALFVAVSPASADVGDLATGHWDFGDVISNTYQCTTDTTTVLNILNANQDCIDSFNYGDDPVFLSYSQYQTGTAECPQYKVTTLEQACSWDADTADPINGESFLVIPVSDSQEFNWAFTSVAVWLPVLFMIRATIRTVSRS